MAVLQWQGTALPLPEVLKQLSLFDTNSAATYTCHPYPFALGKAIDPAKCINEVTEYGKSAVAALTQASPAPECTLLAWLSTLPSSTSATGRRYYILGPALSPALMGYGFGTSLLMLFSFFSHCSCFLHALLSYFKTNYFFPSHEIRPSPGSEEQESTMPCSQASTLPPAVIVAMHFMALHLRVGYL